jgi:2-oxoglutarate ferredoxin oxidoreductase subunit gamma
VSDAKILYPYVTKPEILLVMSQEACNKFLPETTDTAVVIVEEDLVHPRDLKPGMKLYGIPATRLAEELGRKMILNIVMVGFFTSVTKLVDYEAVREAVKASVPQGTEDINLKAFERGYRYGLSLTQ